ncbi:hypothetical protein [Nitrosophilus kaiyonis]|nr:hypothetical protein [Nitrosophilus kaiyonis]
MHLFKSPTCSSGAKIILIKLSFKRENMHRNVGNVLFYRLFV